MRTNHYQPTKKQLDILRILYRFRFATSEQLTQTLHAKRTNIINQRLKLLLDQQYIGRNFEPEYRLLRKHASYYLLPQGISALKQQGTKYDAVVLHNIRNDKTASERFVEQNLGIFEVYCQLRKQYGDNLRFFTKSQLTKYGYFPETLPDAYIRLDVDGIEKQFFLEFLQASKPFFTVFRRLKQYVAYAEDGDWETTNSRLPAILLVCDSPALLKRVIKRAGNAIEDADDELRFYSASLSGLKQTGLWQDLPEPDITVPLSQI